MSFSSRHLQRFPHQLQAQGFEAEAIVSLIARELYRDVRQHVRGPVAKSLARWEAERIVGGAL
jgi:hypothetical protein